MFSYVIQYGSAASPANASRERVGRALPLSFASLMSLSSTTTVKSQLANALGQKAPLYFGVLKEYLAGRISRNEYDEQIKTHLDSTHLRTFPFASRVRFAYLYACSTTT